MTAFVLLSELSGISRADRERPDLHIICDDGDWTPEQVAHYINQWSAHNVLHAEPASDEESYYA